MKLSFIVRFPAYSRIAVAAIAVLSVGQELTAAEPDLREIVRKPIPEKLVVLTFDDGCASHATIVAPTLKRLGFNGTFYVSDFDSFHTRKDWYLTWRQMQAMAENGFEIGNHSRGHAAFSSHDVAGCTRYLLGMEDQFLANKVPEPTTFCWPMYAVNQDFFPALAAHGYAFARGGHSRAYRPTVDHPLDVPSFGISNNDRVETFISYVQQASAGRIVVLTFHGVPDMEHPAVSLDPAIFREMMQYLKDNQYQAIAMRDLAEYVDATKAAELPPTVRHVKEPGPVATVQDDKPYATREIRTFRFPGLPPARIFGSHITVTVPHTTDVTGLAPTLTLTPSATVVPASDVSLDFTKPQTYTVSAGNGPARTYAVTVNKAEVRADRRPPKKEITIGTPIRLATNRTMGGGEDDGPVILKSLISGPGALIKNGPYRLRIDHAANTYSGGTIINSGEIHLLVASAGLGTGPVTLHDGATLRLDYVDATNPLVLNGGSVAVGNGFGSSWNGPVTLNGNTEISAYNQIKFNDKSGGITGPGGLTQVGFASGFSRIGGRVKLCGSNTYRGPTTVKRGILHVTSSLYGNDPANWTPQNINVGIAAELRLSVGGEGEFTAGQAGTMLANLTCAVDHNGVMAGAIFALDTSNAKAAVTLSNTISDSTGPGGGAFVLKKVGAGKLVLSGANTYSGQTIVEGGALCVDSLNRVVGGKASSSLGAPTTVDNGEIVFCGDQCSLIYTGSGEITDRIMNLAGKKSTIAFDQSGTGVLKFTSPILISGYGTSKTIVLTGSTPGAGEIADGITDPYDRAGEATTAVTKSGTGTWTLSGANTYTGATTVTEGTLSLTTAHSLPANTDVHLAKSGMLDLNFEGEIRVAHLDIDAAPQSPGRYNAATNPTVIKGTGVLLVQPKEQP